MSSAERESEEEVTAKEVLDALQEDLDHRESQFVNGLQRMLEDGRGGLSGVQKSIQAIESVVSQYRHHLETASDFSMDTESSEEEGTPPPKTQKRPQLRTRRKTTPREAKSRNNNLQYHIRNHFLTLMKKRSIEEVVKDPPPKLTNEQIRLYDNRESGAPSCTPDHFTIDLSRPMKAFKFNARALDEFVTDFLHKMRACYFDADRKRQIEPHLYLLSEKEIRSTIHLGIETHIKDIRRQLASLVETPHVQHRHQLPTNILRVLRARRQKLKELRDATIHALGSQKPDSWSRHVEVVKKALSVDAMSDDEEIADQFPKRYRIMVPEWQSAELALFLWRLDEWSHYIWANRKNGEGREGSEPHIRAIPQPGNGRVSASPAPVGLPENFYRAQYLQSLRPSELAVYKGKTLAAHPLSLSREALAPRSKLVNMPECLL